MINSTGVGDEGCEDIGSDGGENVGAESLLIGVGGAVRPARVAICRLEK